MLILFLSCSISQKQSSPNPNATEACLIFNEVQSNDEIVISGEMGDQSNEGYGCDLVTGAENVLVSSAGVAAPLFGEI
jgi:hypothetical protein